MIVLLGHNGAGKTTLLHCMLGFYADTAQHPFLPGFNTFLSRKEIGLGKTAYAPEAAYLDHELNARDYFTLVASLHGMGRDETPGVLRRVALDVELEKPIKEYSTGMKQRLLLALALLPMPDTIILDEPTNGLDPYGQEVIEELILELAQTQQLILSTHSLDLAYRLGGEVWILRQGEVVYDGRVGSRHELDTLVRRYRPGTIT